MGTNAQAPLCDFPCDFAIMRECDALGDARQCYLVQTDVRSHTAAIALLYEMSRNIAHALSQKKVQNSKLFLQ